MEKIQPCQALPENLNPIRDLWPVLLLLALALGLLSVGLYARR
jgi:hypothetical protein